MMLHNRQLAAVVSARFVSLTGTNMTVVALPWFVLATTGSTTRMGLVLACQTIPSVVLGVPAGSVVAALGPRRALVLADTLRAPLLAAVPVCSWLGVLSFPLLLLLVTAIGIFSVPYAAASNAILPELVGEDEAEVARATAALQVAIQTTGVIGPVLAGVLIPVLGATAPRSSRRCSQRTWLSRRSLPRCRRLRFVRSTMRGPPVSCSPPMRSGRCWAASSRSGSPGA
jgi:MFS family permease